LRYSEFVVPLVKAMQEMIEEQRAINQDQLGIINKLEKRISTLEKR